MKVSVAVCNFNHGKFINQCLTGYLKQSHEDIEVIVIDDGSTDESKDVIAKVASGDRRVTFISHKENEGLYKRFPEALSKCDGEYLMAGSSDDYLINDYFFELALEGQQSFPCSGAYGITQRVDGKTGKVLSCLGCSNGKEHIPASEFATGFFERTCFVPGHSVMWKRSSLDSIGGFPMDLGPQNDYYVNHLLPSLYGVIFIPVIVTIARIFDTNLCALATVNDKIVRHATFEGRMRKKLGMPDSEIVTKWRNQLIYDLCEGKDIENFKFSYLQVLNKV